MTPRIDRLGNYRLGAGESVRLVLRIRRPDQTLVDLSGLAFVWRIFDRTGATIATSAATVTDTDATFVVPGSETIDLTAAGLEHQVDQLVTGGTVRWLKGSFVAEAGPGLLDGSTTPGDDIAIVDQERGVVTVDARGAPGTNAAELAYAAGLIEAPTQDAFAAFLAAPVAYATEQGDYAKAQGIAAGTATTAAQGVVAAGATILAAVPAAQDAQAGAVSAKAGADAAAALTRSLVDPTVGIANRLPVVHDGKNVLVWIDTGLLEALGVGPRMLADMVAKTGIGNYSAVAASALTVDPLGTADPARTPIARDTAGNVIVWIDHGRLEALAFGPRLAGAVTTAIASALATLGVATVANQAPSKQVLVSDGTNALLWLINGRLDAVGIGPQMMADLRAQLHMAPSAKYLTVTDGRGLKKHRIAVANLARATNKSVKHHVWLTGDSWTERNIIPQAIANDYRAKGVPVVATGWIGLGGSFRIDGSTQSATSGTRVDLQEQGASDGGQYGPDGFRLTFAAGDATAQLVTSVVVGRYLTIYHKANGAAFSVKVDTGSAQPFVAASDGGLGKLAIDLGEGTHTVTISRPSPTGELELYGMFLGSGLPGLTVSVCGNGGSTMAHFAAILSTSTATGILADIAAASPLFTARFCWLTNDGRLGNSVSSTAAAAAVIYAAYRTACPQMEGYVVIPPANAQAGITSGIDNGEYVPALLAAAEAQGFDLINFWSLMPRHDDALWLWTTTGGTPPVDALHFAAEGGGCEYIAQSERRLLNWETA